ncbi:MAG: HAD-IIB family hydrolase [Candidatus Paceibacterota bacterium]
MNIDDKKLIIFDVDQTLTKSKSNLEEDMATLLCELLRHTSVAFISGASFEQLKTQVVDLLPCNEYFERLFILPTSGALFYTYTNGKWELVYQSQLSQTEREHVIRAIEETLDEIELPRPDTLYGERIENRGAQITFSGLGQEAPLSEKKKWDPERKKRKSIQSALAPKLPSFDVRLGGSTSIDVVKKGQNKGAGVERLAQHISIPLSSLLFIGDALFEGGNDASMRDIGVESIRVDNPEETKKYIQSMLRG